jgi:hypothetical protein
MSVHPLNESVGALGREQEPEQGRAGEVDRERSVTTAASSVG